MVTTIREVEQMNFHSDYWKSGYNGSYSAASTNPQPGVMALGTVVQRGNQIGQVTKCCGSFGEVEWFNSDTSSIVFLPDLEVLAAA